ncbi:MAG: hypothetical protein AMJ56_03210 [Anaerolineae bacterium SG8_19]|jgi:hypothetical protein|nr:MAG: hypothetical protein AMJ56_03210 [Anaerolineae bacterium SG8_19]
MAKTTDLKVFITSGEASCEECGEDLGRQAWIFLVRDKGALCLTCADLDHLVYLPAGDAALTRRSRKHSTLVAVVLEWSRARKRYERQGLLVEEEALAQAEQECLADADARARQRERAAARRAIMDKEYVARFAGRVRELYPSCPAGQEVVIAEHACLKYSGRVGRSAEAKELDAEAIRLAVTAHIRHAETDYDELLAEGWERWDARDQVSSALEQILVRWRENG